MDIQKGRQILMQMAGITSPPPKQMQGVREVIVLSFALTAPLFPATCLRASFSAM